MTAMIKEILYTFSFEVCCMNIFTGDGDIQFQDYNTNETVCIEGVGSKCLQTAIKHYVHNLGVDRKCKGWLEEMHAEVSASLALLEGATKD